MEHLRNLSREELFTLIDVHANLVAHSDCDNRADGHAYPYACPDTPWHCLG